METPLSRVLVVDDDEDTLVIARYSLQKFKEIEVRTVISGKAAIQEAIVFQPNLILLDVMMPEMDGFTALKIMKETETIAHIPIVFFTAKVQKEEIKTYLQAGVFDVIVKPFDPITLGTVLQDIWKRYQEGHA